MDDVEPKPEPEVKSLPEPEVKSKSNVSKTQQVKDEVTKLIDSGFELKDKNSKLELNKQVQQNLKLPKGWSSDINKAIKEIAVKKKIQIGDLGFKDEKIGEITVNLVKNDTAPSTEPEVKSNAPSQSPMSSLPANQSTKGALPKVTGSQISETRNEESKEPEKKVMSASAQEKLISNGLTKLLLPVYTAVGICELDEEETKEEAKVPKGQQMKKDFEGLAKDINEFLVENNIQLPALLNYASIGISIFVVLILPVIKFKIFSSNKTPEPEYDESANNIKVD